MTAAVVQGDARCLPLPDASVDLIVTSPPYFGLRSYTDGGAHYDGQIGSEGTPAEWLAALVAATAEWVRVLKPCGSMFVNLGDKYVGGGQGEGVRRRGTGGMHQNQTPYAPTARIVPQGFQPKSLLGLPWRYALACTDQTRPEYRAQFLDGLLADVLDGTITHDRARQLLAGFDASPKSKGLGLILRRDIVWSKPNGLPESVTDRCRSSHEYVFHLVKQPRYYAAVDEIREPHAAKSVYQQDVARRNPDGHRHRRSESPGQLQPQGSIGSGLRDLNPLGALPGSVWSIPSQPLTVPAELGIDHFAAFPMELPRRIILGWSPPGVCTACGEGRHPVADYERIDIRPGYSKTHNGARLGIPQSGGTKWKTKGQTDVTITGYACACPDSAAPTRPSVVLDPFGGTGTTVLVADMLGRHGITIDRSADYSRLARWRTRDPAERARALGVAKPPPVPAGQVSLFDLDGEAS